jgi:hypothetical protein
MILFYEKEIAIITPPKTASSSLLYTLCAHPYYGILCIGPSDNGEYYDQHSIITPPAPFIWKKVAIVRHPLQRFVSLWGHLAREQVLNFQKITSIEEFVYIISNRLHLFYFYQHNQDTILGKDEYTYVHIENLKEELNNLEIIDQNTVLPQINTFRYKNSTPDYKDILSQTMIDQLEWWWKPDSERFNY